MQIEIFNFTFVQLNHLSFKFIQFRFFIQFYLKIPLSMQLTNKKRFFEKNLKKKKLSCKKIIIFNDNFSMKFDKMF